jgi:hypothetical protein
MVWTFALPLVPHGEVTVKRRFIFGGVCTMMAGLTAKRFGPGVGGLFLAFPAIFPASASLIESHEKRRKAEVSMDGTNRGRVAAGIDAAGASLGCIGLIGFAIVMWTCIANYNAIIVIVGAGVVWMVVAWVLWVLCNGGISLRGICDGRSRAR